MIFPTLCLILEKNDIYYNSINSNFDFVNLQDNSNSIFHLLLIGGLFYIPNS